MKKNYATIFCCIVLLLNYFSATCYEVNYFKGTWEQAKAKARAENKMVFVDCYTEWCSWCKVMDKETMIDSEVSELMNKNFVSLKMDMEHGEGIDLSIKYHVYAFPTFLFFNSSGEYVYNIAGYRKKDTFRVDLVKVQNEHNQIKMKGYSQGLDIGVPDFYRKSFGDNKTRTPMTREQVNGFLAKQEDLTSELSWAFIGRTSKIDEKYKNYFVDNKQKYIDLYGERDVKDKLSNIAYFELDSATRSKDSVKFVKALAYYEQVCGKLDENSRESFYFNFLFASAKWKQLLDIEEKKYLTKNIDKPAAQTVNNVCWAIFQNCDDKAILKQATIDMKKVATEAGDYYSMDTYANLLFKQKDKKNAEIWLKKAIACAEKDSINHKSSDELLEKIAVAGKPVKTSAKAIKK